MVDAACMITSDRNYKNKHRAKTRDKTLTRSIAAKNSGAEIWQNALI
jgi:hypothetical protein